MTARKLRKQPQPGVQLKAFLASLEMAAAMGDAKLEAPILVQHLLAHPELIAAPEWRHVIIRILEQHAADHPLRKLSSADTASLVDWWRSLHNVSQAKARHAVTEFTGKTLKAVRHGKRK